MLRIHFESDDLRRVSVARQADPLWDVLLGLHLLQDRRSSPLFDAWKRVALASIPRGAGHLLTGLAPPMGYSPDFLTPGRGDESFEAQLDRLMSTPRKRLARELEHLSRTRLPSTLVHDLRSGDTRSIRRLGAAIQTVHTAALQPFDRHIQTYIDADRDRCAGLLLDGGVDGLLAGIPRSSWEPPVLTVPGYTDHDLFLAGRGIVLVPSLFCRLQPITLADTDEAPVLVYPVTPRIGWCNGQGSPIPGRVAELLGTTRASILEAAAIGAGTSELAKACQISASMASRHAAVLRNAGLITTHRDGNRAVHQLTGLGLALLEGNSSD